MNINKKQILISIPVLFIFGTMLHFLFNISGNIKIIGLIAPVNESVWEHLKLAFFPILVWWIIKISQEGLNNKYKKLIALAVSSILSICTITSFFYTYTGAFGIKSLVLDIFSLFLGILIGQIIAYYTFIYLDVKKSYVCISVIAIMTILILFFIFTFYPPNIPLFKDPRTGFYGIFSTIL